MTDPIKSQEDIAARDSDTIALRALLNAWKAMLDTEASTVSAAIKMADSGVPEADTEGQREAFLEAVEMAVGRKGDTSRKLGKYLAKHRDRHIDGLMFVNAGDRAGIIRWAVKSTDGSV